MARALAMAGVEAIYSYAGRTANPAAQPLPCRVGGFGGVEGLIAYLKETRISHVIDATHPFAAGISGNAIRACKVADVPLIALERPAWQAEPGDDWLPVANIEGAIAALPTRPSRVFLAIGRQNLPPFAARPEHDYLLRLVDPPGIPPLSGARVVVDRGPFTLAGDLALLRDHRIDIVVAKNAGGSGAIAKIEAARQLGLRVIMIARPVLPARPVLARVDEVMRRLCHEADLGL